MKKSIFVFTILLSIIVSTSSFPVLAFANQSPLVVDDNIEDTSDTYAPGQVVVGLKNPDPLFEGKVVNRGGQIINTLEKIDSFVIQVPHGNEDRFISSISKNPNIAFAERDAIVKAAGHYPDDTFFDELWGLQRIGMTSVWDNNPTSLGEGIIVAVVDTGVYHDHPDLDPKRIRTDIDKDFVDDDYDTRPTSICVGPGGKQAEFHGTFVSGVVGAATNNAKGVAGVAPVDILPVRVLGTCGSGTSSDVADGILHAADKGADVINLSLGSSFPSSVIQLAVTEAYNTGSLIVGAAGNDGSDDLFYPASFDEVISVSAIDRNDALASYSNWGEKIELSGPGGDSGSCQVGDVSYILSTGVTVEGNSIEFVYLCAAGTSFAAPHVSGVAALLFASDSLSNEQVRLHLRDTAEDIGEPGLDKQFGYGLVRADLALNQASEPIADTEGPTPIISTSETSPTNANPVPFTIDFGEPIDESTFVSSDITVTSDGIVDNLVGSGDNQNWSFEVKDPIDPSTLSVSIQAGVLEDTSGNKNLESNTINIDIDRTASAAPSIDEPSSPTNDNTPTITGTGVSGETITLKSDLDGIVGTTSVSGEGSWSITTSTLQVGTHSITATQTDSAGNISPSSSPVSLEIQALPGVDVSKIDPNNGSKGSSIPVTVYGSGFMSGAQVILENGSGPAPDVSVESVSDDGTTITAKITIKSGGPPRSSSWDVVVINPDSSSGTLFDGFTVT